MEIKTRDFGLIDIEEKELIDFPHGVFSFEEHKKFVFIENQGYTALWLQSAQGENPCFIVFDPLEFIKDYAPKLPKGSLAELKAKSPEELCFFVIAVIPQNIREMTVNLKSPIVVNPSKNRGMQIILENEEYGVRCRVFPEDAEGGQK